MTFYWFFQRLYTALLSKGPLGISARSPAVRRAPRTTVIVSPTAHVRTAQSAPECLVSRASWSPGGVVRRSWACRARVRVLWGPALAQKSVFLYHAQYT